MAASSRNQEKVQWERSPCTGCHLILGRPWGVLSHFTRRWQWLPSAWLVDEASKSKGKSWSMGFHPRLVWHPLTLAWPNGFCGPQTMKEHTSHLVLLLWRHRLKISSIFLTWCMSRGPTPFGHVQRGIAGSFESGLATLVLYSNPQNCTDEFIFFLFWEGRKVVLLHSSDSQSWPYVRSLGEIS